MSTESEGVSLTAAVLREVGARLRRHRTRRDLTLDALSGLTGISASTISRLESGRRAPNLQLLVPLARALRIGIDDLLMWDAPAPRTESPRRRHGAITAEYLSPAAASTQALKLTFAPGIPTTLRSHEGTEWLHVLDGRIRLILGSDERELAAGGTVQFDTRIPHGVIPLDNRPAAVLAVFAPQGAAVAGEILPYRHETSASPASPP